MRNSNKPGHERKNSRRRSWLIGNNLLNMFSSAPPSPEYKDVKEIEELLGRQRSQSLTPIEDYKNVRPLLRSSQKSTFSSFLTKAGNKKKQQQLSIQTENMNPQQQPRPSPITRQSSNASTATSATSLSTLDPLQFFQVDEDEADRIQLKNDLVKLAFDGEFSLPLDYKTLSKGKILDVGCGPGAWCIDLATKYPQLEVVGVDSDDMFPDNLPNNCQLLVNNVLTGLKDFPQASFDVIHIRFMVLAFTIEQYPLIVQDCWRLLKPGGYIEILETDLTVHSAGPITNKLNQQMIQVAISKGLNPRQQAESLQELIPKEAITPQINYRSIPMGVWGGRIGVLCRDDMLHMLTKFQPYIPTANNLTFEQDISIVRKEMDQYKSFSNYYFCTAQKPYLPSPPPSIQQQRTCTKPLLQREYTSSFNPKAL